MLRVFILCGCCLILRTEAQRLPQSEEFPGLRFIPQTSFDCKTRPVGYYADPDPATRCQVYHMCDMKGNKFSYLCPNGTLFHQQHLICAHWYQVNCTRTLSLYEINKQMFPFAKFEADVVQDTSPQAPSTVANIHQQQTLPEPAVYKDQLEAIKPATPRRRGKPVSEHNHNTVTSKFLGDAPLPSGTGETEEPSSFKQPRFAIGVRQPPPSSRPVAPATRRARVTTDFTPTFQQLQPVDAIQQQTEQLPQESIVTAAPALPPQSSATESLTFGSRHTNWRQRFRGQPQTTVATSPPPLVHIPDSSDDDRGNNIPPLPQQDVTLSRPSVPQTEFSPISPRRTSSRNAWTATSPFGPVPPGTEQFGVPLNGEAASSLAPEASWTPVAPRRATWTSFRPSHRIGSLAEASQSAAGIDVLADPEYGTAVRTPTENTESHTAGPKLTMRFPKDGRIKKYGVLPINEKCPRCNPYFLKNDRCSPCVIIR